MANMVLLRPEASCTRRRMAATPGHSTCPKSRLPNERTSGDDLTGRRLASELLERSECRPRSRRLGSLQDDPKQRRTNENNPIAPPAKAREVVKRLRRLAQAGRNRS